MPFVGELRDDSGKPVREPMGMLRGDARPGDAAGALHLVAFDRQHDFVAAAVAGDDAELSAQHIVEHRRKVAGGAALVGGADDELLGERVREGFCRRIGARDADEHLVVGIAEIDELARVEIRLLAVAKERLEHVAG